MMDGSTAFHPTDEGQGIGYPCKCGCNKPERRRPPVLCKCGHEIVKREGKWKHMYFYHYERNSRYGFRATTPSGKCYFCRESTPFGEEITRCTETKP